ncbi:transcriptional regulator [Citricoccus sp. NPDC055426]|uniref:transcriptional regulator n=1 Tax=Citricoccus sp. NPDC055426 TaxID=3155536 RepID=UPI0034143661
MSTPPTPAGVPGLPGDTGPSSPELIVLHAVRLAGFADTAAVTERSVLDASTIERHLIELARGGLVDRMSFGGTGGWILTDAGTGRVTALLAEERASAGAHAVLKSTAAGFEDLNGRLVRTLTQWQLGTPTDRAELREDTLAELTDLADSLESLLADLIIRLPRFARYPRQFTAAARKARAGQEEWVAGVGLLSCHTVWAELHQDLLSSLGRRRGHPGSSGPGADGR